MQQLQHKGIKKMTTAKKNIEDMTMEELGSLLQHSDKAYIAKLSNKSESLVIKCFLPKENLNSRFNEIVRTVTVELLKSRISLEEQLAIMCGEELERN